MRHKGNRALHRAFADVGKISGAICVCVALQMAAGAGVAQSVPESPQGTADPLYDGPKRGETVRDRQRPGYDPIGVRVGSFFLYPEVGVEEFYRDNIFFSESGEESDFVTVVAPRASLKSNWDNHSLVLSGGAEAGRYLDNDSEDYLDWDFGSRGRVDIERGFALSGGAQVERKHDDRRSVDQVGAAEPVTYLQYGADATLTKRLNRAMAQVAASVQWFAYDDVDAVGGGTFRSGDRDRRVTEGSVRTGYSISPQFEPFIQIGVNDRSYDQRLDDNGFERDSHGWDASVGTTFDLTGVTFGEVYIGYLAQYYDRSGFDTIDGVGFGGSLTWNPTGLTTVILGGDRTVEETTLSGASGALRSGLDLSVDHELLRNLILSGSIGAALVEYRDIDRDDQLGTVGVGATYLANEYLKLDLSYSNANRDSSVDSADYNAQTVRFRVTGRL